MKLGYALNAFQINKSQQFIKTIKNVSLFKKDYGTYTTFSYFTSEIGKKFHYSFESRKEIILGEIEGEKIPAILVEDKKHRTGLLYFDDQHYKDLDEEEMIHVKRKTNQYLYIINEIYPESIVGADGRKTYYDDLEPQITQRGREYLGGIKMGLAQQYGLNVIPVSEKLMLIQYENKKYFNFTYRLTNKEDQIAISDGGGLFIFTNLEKSSADGTLFDQHLDTRILNQNIRLISKESRYMIDQLVLLESEIDQNYATLLKITHIEYIDHEKKNILAGKKYPNDYFFGSSLIDKFGNNVYFVFSQKDNFFQLIKTKK